MGKPMKKTKEKVKFRIKKGDKVTVISGSHKGKVGEVLRVITEKGRVVVGGVNFVKKHTAPTMTSQGGIVSKEASINISNVAYLDPKENKATKITYKILADGKKVRVAKRSGEVIES